MLHHPTLSFKPSSFPFRQPRSCATMSARAEVACLSAADRRSLYEVLRVKRNASQVEIKTAYRTLAKLHHPDAMARFMDSSIATSADDRYFIEIHNAYVTLSDPDARAEYDLNIGGCRSPDRVSFYQTRRWETDQCW